MASLDEIFYREFNGMMYQRRGMNGQMNLNDIELPAEAAGKFFIEKRDKVKIIGIEDRYYSKLNGTESLLWGRHQLKRRKFDYKGEFIRKDGNYVLEDVTCPSDCTAVVSRLSLGVPNKYKAAEPFAYVDMITKGDQSRFVYIVPKKYCYRVKQTALVLSWNKLRRFYQGVGLSLQTGHVLYMYVVPYNPSSQSVNYRVLHCKTSVDYSEEIMMLKNFWIKRGIIFDPAKCQMMDFVKGRENMAYFNLDSTEDMYEVFDASKPMGEDDSFEDIEFATGEE